MKHFQVLEKFQEDCSVLREAVAKTHSFQYLQNCYLTKVFIKYLTGNDLGRELYNLYLHSQDYQSYKFKFGETFDVTYEKRRNFVLGASGLYLLFRLFRKKTRIVKVPIYFILLSVLFCRENLTKNPVELNDQISTLTKDIENKIERLKKH